MPYKDPDKAKEYNKERMRATRAKDKVVQPKSVQPYVLSDGQIHDLSKAPDAVIPDRVFISRVHGAQCALPRHEFIRAMRDSNRANELRFKHVDLKTIESLKAIIEPDST